MEPAYGALLSDSNNRVEEKECKATVSTHVKHSQDLHQIYTIYASVSKEWGISVDYTAEMPELEGEALCITKATILQQWKREEHINLHQAKEYEHIRYQLIINIMIQYPEILTRLATRKDLRAFHIY